MKGERLSLRTVIVAVFITAAAYIAEAGAADSPSTAPNSPLPAARPDSRAALNTKVSPFDQSNARRDLDRTAAIRKALVDSNRFSHAAKNIQIVTVADGTVFLTGKTRSTAELQDVLNVAQGAAQGAVIVNRLEVEPKKQ